MIEYRNKSLVAKWSDRIRWRKVNGISSAEECYTLFRYRIFRIHGQVFEKYSVTFVEEFNKAKMWEKLHD